MKRIIVVFVLAALLVAQIGCDAEKTKQDKEIEAIKRNKAVTQNILDKYPDSHRYADIASDCWSFQFKSAVENKTIYSEFTIEDIIIENGKHFIVAYEMSFSKPNCIFKCEIDENQLEILKDKGKNLYEFCWAVIRIDKVEPITVKIGTERNSGEEGGRAGQFFEIDPNQIVVGKVLDIFKAR